jgi:hypothetical protein
MIERYLKGFKEWAKLGWAVTLAVICSIVNLFIEPGPISGMLDVAYIVLMIVYIVNVLRHNREMRVFRDKTTWLSFQIQ